VTIPTLFNAWRHIQLLVTVHNTAGAVQVVVDGVTYVNLSGVDTQNTANAYASEALWNNNVGWGGFYFDDIYAADYLAGDLAVKYLPATSDSSIQFTRSTGSNSYANVDEAAGGHDSDSTYNYSSTVGHRDLYGVSYALAGSVKAVQMFAAARKDDAGTRGAKLIVKSGSAESLSSETSLSTSWMPIIGPVLQTDPNTSTAWTQSTVNAAKIGIEITS
jgi:hypothetical protein